MSETLNIKCPDCSHLAKDHHHFASHCMASDLTNPPSCECPCTRTYESLVGEKDAEYAKSFTPHDTVNFFHDAKPEPSLQLLVIDMGDTCLVKVEKGKHCDVQFGNGDDRNDIVYSAVPTIIWASFTELREAIDGVKPVPRIEYASDGGSYDLYYMGDGRVNLSKSAFHALTTINGGKSLPLHESGKWRQIGWQTRPDDKAICSKCWDAMQETGYELRQYASPIDVYRYTRHKAKVDG